MNRLSGNLRGIVLMVAASGAFITNDTLVKLVTSELPVGELVFVRAVMCCAMAFAGLVATRSLHTLRALSDAKVLWRSALDLLVTILYLPALANMPIANSSTIIQAQPLAVTAGAAIFLDEKVGWRRWCAIAVGFVGVVVVARPGAEGFNGYALLAVSCIFFSAGRDLITRNVPPRVSGLVIITGGALGLVVGGALVGLLFGERWVNPSWQANAYLLASAVLLMAGYFMAIVALRTAEISVISPFRYSLILFAIASGFLVWGDVPDLQTLFGIAIIMSAGLYTVHRERLRMRALRAESAVPRTPASS